MKKKKTRIEKKLKKKKNSELVETIIAAKKQKNWLEVANLISRPKNKLSKKNLFEINKETEKGDAVLIPGKILATGALDKKVRIIALSFSTSAVEKMKKTKSEAVYIIDEIKSNPKAEGIKIIK